MLVSSWQSALDFVPLELFRAERVSHHHDNRVDSLVTGHATPDNLHSCLFVQTLPNLQRNVLRTFVKVNYSSVDKLGGRHRGTVETLSLDHTGHSCVTHTTAHECYENHMILGCCSCRENRTPAPHAIAINVSPSRRYLRPIDIIWVTCVYFQLYHTRIQVCFQTVQDRQISILADFVPDILLTICCNAILTNLIPMT